MSCPPRIQILPGQRFGRLVAVRKDPEPKRNEAWVTMCDCGSEKIVAKASLVRGLSKSCGCLRREVVSVEAKKRFTKHGLSGTPEYAAWLNMWDRCTNPENDGYELYKNRTPPEEWRDVETFVKDMGLRPSDQHSLDRENNEEPYGPKNCRWATVEEQQNNKSNNLWIEHNSERKTIGQWARIYGLSFQTLQYRVNKGLTGDELFAPVR